MACESKMRAEASAFTSSDNLKTEYTPFTFAIKDGNSTIEIRNVPMAYVIDLWRKISEVLDMNDDEATGYDHYV